jgi:hypothetical protein
MKKYLIVLTLLCGCNNNLCNSLPTEEITDMYASYIDDWKRGAKLAFDDAEVKIFQINPKPIIIDDTNPDPAKCVCKGTGIIVQGDGHKTPCPFHSKALKK